MKTNDENQQQLVKDREKLDEGQLMDDMKWLMSHAQGRRLMYGFLERANVFALSMTGNSWTFYNEGRRSVGNEYFGIITSDFPEQYLLMMQEANESKQRMKEISDD